RFTCWAKESSVCVLRDRISRRRSYMTIRSLTEKPITVRSAASTGSENSRFARESAPRQMNTSCARLMIVTTPPLKSKRTQTYRRIPPERGQDRVDRLFAQLGADLGTDELHAPDLGRGGSGRIQRADDALAQLRRVRHGEVSPDQHVARVLENLDDGL